MSILKTYKIAASTALLFMGGVAFAQNDPASNFSSYDGVT